MSGCDIAGLARSNGNVASAAEKVLNDNSRPHLISFKLYNSVCSKHNLYSLKSIRERDKNTRKTIKDDVIRFGRPFQLNGKLINPHVSVLN